VKMAALKVISVDKDKLARLTQFLSGTQRCSACGRIWREPICYDSPLYSMYREHLSEIITTACGCKTGETE